MYEHMADMFGGPPNVAHFALYSQWAQHHWGMIITGNVQVSATHLTLGRDMTIPREISEETLQPFRKLARIIHQEDSGLEISAHASPRSLAIMQLSHAGRQSPRILGGRFFAPPLAPSAVALGSGRNEKSLISGLFHRLLFQKPREMSLADINTVTAAFVRGAKLAVLAGFDGIQLHAAHGCEY
jgi:2,4-dienoyl-CoA reductase-like NADH-dependent reductase (Old Yellow Enzyme family)